MREDPLIYSEPSTKIEHRIAKDERDKIIVFNDGLGS